MNTRFQAQDTQNFIIFQDRATSITQAQVDASVAPNTSAIAVNTAATSANQSLIAQANINIADVYLGNLIGLNVYNPAASGSNTLEIRCRPDASANQASLQIVHDHTASGSRAKLGFWDQTISGSSSTAPSTALTLAWDGDAQTHTSTFAGGLSVTGTMACQNLIVTGIVTMPGGGAASVGEVLKSTRVCKSPHSNVTLTGNSSTITCTSQSYTPISTNSLINVTFVGTRLMAGTTSSWGQWLSSIVVNGVEIGNTMHGHNSLSQHVDSAPIFASYTNSSLSPITFTVTLRSITGGGTAHIIFYQQSGAKSCWFHFEEVQA